MPLSEKTKIVANISTILLNGFSFSLIMKNPQEWFEQTVRYYEEKTRENSKFKHYTDKEFQIKALGDTYNNWVMRFKRRDGSSFFGINFENCSI